MRWPRGKYNGRPITGFEIHFTVDLWHWEWLPFIRWNHCMPLTHWLCIRIRWTAHYD